MIWITEGRLTLNAPPSPLGGSTVSTPHASPGTVGAGGSVEDENPLSPGPLIVAHRSYDREVVIFSKMVPASRRFVFRFLTATGFDSSESSPHVFGSHSPHLATLQSHGQRANGVLRHCPGTNARLFGANSGL